MFKRFKKSLQYALAGLRTVFREERNFRIHLFFTVLVLLLAVYFSIAVWQFIILLLVIALVLILEIINSVLERLIDLLKPRLHQYVKDIKDMGAALVFIGAVAAVLIGILIFLPYFIERLK